MMKSMLDIYDCIPRIELMYSRFIDNDKQNLQIDARREKTRSYIYATKPSSKNVGKQFCVIFSANQLVQSAKRNLLIAYSRTISQFDECQKTEERDNYLKINLQRVKIYIAFRLIKRRNASFS
jgi:hypothetical protein